MKTTETFKQRLAEAGKLLVGHIKENRISLSDKALKTAKRNSKKYNAAARQEYVHSKAVSH